jgi:hypothetical protein
VTILSFYDVEVTSPQAQQMVNDDPEQHKKPLTAPTSTSPQHHPKHLFSCTSFLTNHQFNPTQPNPLSPATMKFSPSLLLASTAFLGLARANFDLYIEIQTEPISGTVTRFWKIFEAEPDCAGVSDSLGYFDEDDASGGRAVRCEGDGCDPSGDVNTITELEMNFGTEGGPVWHWSTLCFAFFCLGDGDWVHGLYL